MDLVFAKGAQIIGDVRVVFGSHWPADDPFVIEHPSLFSRDPRWGLVYTIEPPGYRDGTDDLSHPPPEPVPVAPVPAPVRRGRPVTEAKPDA